MRIWVENTGSRDVMHILEWARLEGAKGHTEREGAIIPLPAGWTMVGLGGGEILLKQKEEGEDVSTNGVPGGTD